MKASGFCLMSPSGKLVPDTFSVDQDECWTKAFSFLYATKKWMKPFYKQWDQSIKEAEKRGWVIVEVTIQVDV